MSLAYRVVTVTALLLLGTVTIVRADVPKPEDVAACNAEAKEATRKGPEARSASPNTDDHRRAADARRGSTPAAGTPGSNPQVEGMDPARAGEPAYQAAYRACMRKAGF